MTDDDSTTNLNYYAAVTNTSGKNANYSVTGNPGSNTKQDYITQPTADSLMIFEDDGTNYPGFVPSSWVAQYPCSSLFIFLTMWRQRRPCPTMWVLPWSRKAGWIFITDDTLLIHMARYRPTGQMK